MNEDEPIWLTVAQVKLLHAGALDLFGGLPGIRDGALLESALARAQNRFFYEEGGSLFDLAAAYGCGIARNHAFVDGNKRTALLAVRTFLFRNGYAFNPDVVETVRVMEGVAAGELSEKWFADWIQASSAAR